MSKLSEYDVLNIREELANGMSRKELALRYGVATETVAKIARRNTFVHVGTPAIPDTRLEEMAAASQNRLLKAARELQTKMEENCSTESEDDTGALSSETLKLMFGA